MTHARVSPGAEGPQKGPDISFLQPVWERRMGRRGENEKPLEVSRPVHALQQSLEFRGTLEKIQSKSFAAQRSDGSQCWVELYHSPRLPGCRDLGPHVLCLLPRLRRWRVEQRAGWFLPNPHRTQRATPQSAKGNAFPVTADPPCWEPLG